MIVFCKSWVFLIFKIIGLGLNHKHNATSTRNIATVLPPSAPGNALISVTAIIFGWTPFPATTNY